MFVKKIFDSDLLLIIILLIWFFILGGCKPKPDFYIDGKPYMVVKTCTKEELTHQFYGPKFSMECVEWRIDTIEIKNEK